MTGPRFPLPLYYGYIAGSANPLPTNAEAETSDRSAQLKDQEAHLHALRTWAHTSRGPCATCRWRDDSRCMNPAVLRGTADPFSGEVEWKGPPCLEERSGHKYSDSYYNRPRRWTGRPLCGPLGLLWEERTTEQFLTRWLLSGLHLLWICGGAAILIGIIALGSHGRP